VILAAVQGLLRSAADAGRRLARRPARRQAADRRLLEDRILPACAGRAGLRRVLFVGTAAYAQRYEAFFAGLEYWTIDPSPRRRRWGARRHVVDRLEHIGQHLPPHCLDLIVCNGVLGWGLNRRADAEAAFDACHTVLRDGGELVVGWNDVWPRNRVLPASLRALARFERAALPGFDAPVLRIDAPHRHVFECYRKPAGGSAALRSRSPTRRGGRSVAAGATAVGGDHGR
jgi:SAM-dependent methyltransferase